MGLNWQDFHIVRNSNGKLCSTYPKYLVIIALNRSHPKTYKGIYLRSVSKLETVIASQSSLISHKIIKPVYGEQLDPN